MYISVCNKFTVSFHSFTKYILMEPFVADKIWIYFATGTHPRVLESKRLPGVQACSLGRSFTQIM